MDKDNNINPNTLSLSYADRLWQSWQDDPTSVPPAWREWFAAQEGLAPGEPAYQISGAASDRQLADQKKSINSSATIGCGATAWPD
jgi:2-oxoglutarate dehydrogenase complex dehydrogenase (E1) component-like enzyme